MEVSWLKLSCVRHSRRRSVGVVRPVQGRRAAPPTNIERLRILFFALGACPHFPFLSYLLNSADVLLIDQGLKRSDAQRAGDDVVITAREPFELLCVWIG